MNEMSCNETMVKYSETLLENEKVNKNKQSKLL